MKSLLISLVLSGLWLAVGYVFLGVQKRAQYREAFERTQEGEPLSSVLTRFGQPSHIEVHGDAKGYDHGNRSACGESCWLRIWYEMPFTLGTAPVSVDFDATQHVIGKYQWNSP